MYFKICIKKSKKDTYYGVVLIEDSKGHQHYLSFDFKTIISLLSIISDVTGDNLIASYLEALASKHEYVVFSADLLSDLS